MSFFDTINYLPSKIQTGIKAQALTLIDALPLELFVASARQTERRDER
jgi:hypothetical protein